MVLQYFYMLEIYGNILHILYYILYYYGLARIQARGGHVSSADRLYLLDAVKRRLVQQLVEISYVLQVTN